MRGSRRTHLLLADMLSFGLGSFLRSNLLQALVQTLLVLREFLLLAWHTG
jgi:hypothetical protein